MLNKLKNIRQQPEHVRRHILHIVTIVAGIILVLLWIYSLGTTLASGQAKTEIKQDLQPITSSLQNNTSIPSSW